MEETEGGMHRLKSTFCISYNTAVLVDVLESFWIFFHHFIFHINLTLDKLQLFVFVFLSHPSPVFRAGFSWKNKNVGSPSGRSCQCFTSFMYVCGPSPQTSFAQSKNMKDHESLPGIALGSCLFPPCPHVTETSTQPMTAVSSQSPLTL